MEQKVTREVLTITQLNPSESDRQVGVRFNEVSLIALNVAERYLLFGPDSARLAVTKSFLSSISRLAAAAEEEAITYHREAFMRELASMTEVQTHLTNAEIEAITVGTHDQDDN